MTHEFSSFGSWVQYLQNVDSLVMVRGLICSVACRILVLQPRVKPTSPALQGGFFTTGHSGKWARPVGEDIWGLGGVDRIG